MLIIGHRGADGTASETTLEAPQSGVMGEIDMLEFDVRVTHDGVPIVIHDSHLLRAHKKETWVQWSNHESLHAAVEKGHKIALLDEVMQTFFGKVYLNLELKGRASARATLHFIAEHYITRDSDWDYVLFSSFHVNELEFIRKTYPRAPIALLHRNNPFGFVAYQRRLQFDAVGFKRSALNPLALEIAKKAGLFTYVYTVNRPGSLSYYIERGVDAIITDFPSKMVTALNKLK